KLQTNQCAYACQSIHTSGCLRTENAHFPSLGRRSFDRHSGLLRLHGKDRLAAKTDPYRNDARLRTNVWRAATSAHYCYGDCIGSNTRRHRVNCHPAQGGSAAITTLVVMPDAT